MKSATLRNLFLNLALLVMLILPLETRAMWVDIGGEDELILTRCDTGLHSPWHEQTVGRYGYYDSYMKWVDVLDFSRSGSPLYPPFTWSIIVWKAGPLDWNGGLTLLRPMELPDQDQFAAALRGETPSRRPVIEESFVRQTALPPDFDRPERELPLA